MPSPVTTNLPVPKSWDEFEDMCADLLKRLWRDPYVNRYGRSGQKQFGVDIYGKPYYLKEQGTGLAAAQCKRVEVFSQADIDAEVTKATSFIPTPEEYLLLTTLKRDVTLQDYVRNKTWPIKRVEIQFWDDISIHISESDELLKKYYPRWFQGRISQDDIVQLLSTSVSDDFEYDDSIGQYLHKKDVNLRLHEDRREEPRKFEEDWVTKFPSPNAYSQQIYLEYGGNRIQTFMFVVVDGGRYTIPYPNTPIDLRISQFQYHLAKILNVNCYSLGLDFALNQAGIVVDPIL